MRLAVACGGTGGHIFPGLATAWELRARGKDVTLWLAGKDIESQAVVGWDGPIVTVRAQGMPQGISARLAGFALGLLGAGLRCRALLRQSRPDALLAMGSYASVGPVLAADWLRIPIVLHEANVIPGRAVRFLARRAAAVATAFDQTRMYLKHPRLVLTGMPLRKTLRDARGLAVDRWFPGLTSVLVMGGSRGAHALNEIVSAALCDMSRRGCKVAAIHLSGTADETFVRDRYAAAGVPARVFAFLAEVEQAFVQADLAVCRSGAATCAELSYFGLPSVLIPYPYAARQHQAANARALADRGAARLVMESELDAKCLAELLSNMIDNPLQLAQMRDRIRGCMPENGAARLADLVEEVASSHVER